MGSLKSLVMTSFPAGVHLFYVIWRILHGVQNCSRSFKLLMASVGKGKSNVCNDFLHAFGPLKRLKRILDSACIINYRIWRKKQPILDREKGKKLLPFVEVTHMMKFCTCSCFSLNLQMEILPQENAVVSFTYLRFAMTILTAHLCMKEFLFQFKR